MAAELTRRTTTQREGTWVETDQTDEKNGSETQEQTGQTISTVTPGRTESTRIMPAVTESTGATEYLGMTISFTVRFSNTMPVLPPGETPPAAC